MQENLQKLSKREILEYVIDHISKEGRAIEGISCSYLTKEGKRCGHSICIKDELLTNKIFQNGYSAEHIINKLSDNIHKPQFQGKTTSFWGKIQTLHDDPRFWDENSLNSVGEAYKELIINELDD